MTTPPPAMLQHHGEFTALLELYRERRPRRVLEVGVGEGGTLWHWLRDAEPGTTIVAVDDRHQNRHHYAEWTPLGVKLVPLLGDSTTWAMSVKVNYHGPYDFVLLDGDHHDRAVRADWRLYREQVVPGGLIALHDIAPTSDPTVEVDGLWAELRAEEDVLEIIEPSGFGIGVVRVPREAPVFQSEGAR